MTVGPRSIVELESEYSGPDGSQAVPTWLGAGDEAARARLRLTEEEILLREPRLDREAHELERALTALVADVHRRLCRAPGEPIDARVDRIVRLVEAATGGLDLSRLRREVDEIAVMRAAARALRLRLAGDRGRISALPRPA